MQENQGGNGENPAAQNGEEAKKDESEKKPRKNGNRAYKVENLIDEPNGIMSLYKKFTKESETV